MDIKNLKAVNVGLEECELNGEKVIRVTKPADNLIPDVDTYAKVIDSDFHNGTITVKVFAKLLPTAPDYARGFIGIVFRANKEDNEFESYYVRPTNGRHPDPVRRSHGSQYFSYPGYTFDYFRKHEITKYEAPVDIDLEEWITIKAVINDDHGEFYVNDMEHPALVVDGFKHGKDARGTVGLYTDIGTDGYFKDLEIEYAD